MTASEHERIQSAIQRLAWACAVADRVERGQEPELERALPPFAGSLRRLRLSRRIIGEVADRGGWTPELEAWRNAADALVEGLQGCLRAWLLFLRDVEEMERGERREDLKWAALAWEDLQALARELPPYIEAFHAANRAARTVTFGRATALAFERADADADPRGLDGLLSGLGRASSDREREAFWEVMRRRPNLPTDGLERYVGRSIDRRVEVLEELYGEDHRLGVRDLERLERDWRAAARRARGVDRRRWRRVEDPGDARRAIDGVATTSQPDFEALEAHALRQELLDAFRTREASPAERELIDAFEEHEEPAAALRAVGDPEGWKRWQSLQRKLRRRLQKKISGPGV